MRRLREGGVRFDWWNVECILWWHVVAEPLLSGCIQRVHLVEMSLHARFPRLIGSIAPCTDSVRATRTRCIMLLEKCSTCGCARCVFAISFGVKVPSESAPPKFSCWFIFLFISPRGRTECAVILQMSPRVHLPWIKCNLTLSEERR